MWHRLALTFLVALAMAGSALAQSAGSADAKLRSEIEAVFTAWLGALNKHDGRAASAFFAPGAPAINPAGLVAGDSQDYVNRVEQQGNRTIANDARIERVEAIGSDWAYASGPYTATSGPNNNRQQQQGFWLQVFERSGGTWKIAASTFTQVGPARPLGK
jgi:ketosteroid isomerase-like protein